MVRPESFINKIRELKYSYLYAKRAAANSFLCRWLIGWRMIREAFSSPGRLLPGRNQSSSLRQKLMIFKGNFQALAELPAPSRNFATIVSSMCRSIKVLRRPDQAPTPEELNAAALQFVRKISGFRKPSKANHDAFERAVAEVAASSRRLLDGLSSPNPAPLPPTASEPYSPSAVRPSRARRSRDAVSATAPGHPPDRPPA